MTEQFLEGGFEPPRSPSGPARWFSRAFRLQGKLIIPYVALTLVLAILGIFVVTRLVSATYRERFVNLLYESARIASDAVARQENENLTHLRAASFTAGMNTAVAARDAAAIETLITPMAYNYDLDAIIVLDRNGVEILTLGKNPAGNYTRSAQGVDFSGYDFVRQVLLGAADDQGDKFIGLLHAPNEPTLYTGAPVYDAQSRRVVGAVLIGAPLSRLLADITTQGLDLADVIVFDESRRVLITTLMQPAEGFGSLEAFAGGLSEADLADVSPVWVNDRSYQITFTPLEARGQRFGWLAVLMPSEYVVAAESTSRNFLILIFTFGALAMFGIGWVIAQSIARPILKLRNLTQAVAAGDLNQEIGLNSPDEIGELAGAFDLMTLRLRERTAETARLYAEAIQRNQELAETNARLRSTQQQLIQSEKLAAIGQLTAGIVHDVKNPLTVVKGVAELVLSEDDLSDELRQEIALMRDSAVKANNIVSDLLKFARQSRPELEVHDLRETIEAALRLTAFPIRKAHVQATKDLPAEPVRLAYDDQQIEQVLVNIISNALQAMPSGGRLRVHLHTCDGVAAIAIQDTGAGIPAEIVNRIFDPFFTTKPEGEGTGLGLSVSYGIITNHNGRIEVASTPGEGSTFTILLPVRQSEPVGVAA